MAELTVPIKITIDPAVRKEVARLRRAGAFKVELCGHLECAGDIKGFTLDKRKYRMRFEDETEDSVRVIIEPNE